MGHSSCRAKCLNALKFIRLFLNQALLGHYKCLIRLQRSKIVDSYSSCHLNSSCGEVLIPGASYSDIFCGITIHLMVFKINLLQLDWILLKRQDQPQMDEVSKTGDHQNLGLLLGAEPSKSLCLDCLLLQTYVPSKEQILHPDLDLSN